MKDGQTKQLHHRVCNLCEAMCGLVIETEGQQVISIKGDKKDPFSKGHICPKAVALQDLYTDPDRLKYPVKKTADGWQQISWKEAFDTVAQEIKKTQKSYGRDSVATYQGNPSVHNLGTMTLGGSFVRQLGTKNRFTATSADQLPHHLAAAFMFGHALLIPIPDIDRTDHIIILGANPAVSNGSMMTAAGAKKRLQAIQKRSGKVVVVDPRYTETAAFADQHFFIRPGTDALFLLAFLHTLVKEGLTKPGRLAVAESATKPNTPEPLVTTHA